MSFARVFSLFDLKDAENIVIARQNNMMYTECEVVQFVVCWGVFR